MCNCSRSWVFLRSVIAIALRRGYAKDSLFTLLKNPLLGGVPSEEGILGEID